MPAREEARIGLPMSQRGQKEVIGLYEKIQRSCAKLVSPDGRSRNLPVSLDKFLLKLVADLHEGRSVAIVLGDVHLTTVEAARLLGVSRQFLIKVLKRGELPHHMVGTHRRIYMRDLLAYKAQRDGKRRRILDELTRAEAQDNLYELEPPDDRPA